MPLISPLDASTPTIRLNMNTNTNSTTSNNKYSFAYVHKHDVVLTLKLLHAQMIKYHICLESGSLFDTYC